MTIHLLFEQSGTFKNAFKSLGFKAIDYDNCNQFNETDIVCELYHEIDNAFEWYVNKGNYTHTIFDNIAQTDLLFAFFPCTRFSIQTQLWFSGNNYVQQNWSDEEKLMYSMKLHKELSRNYEVLSKLVLICKKRKLKLIIENPYNGNYLKKYFPIKPTLIDLDRRKKGDYFKKPTMYFFINLQPKYIEINDEVVMKDTKQIESEHGIDRSLISSDYAIRFIKEYVL